MDFIRMREVLDLCVLKRCHHIPGILVAFKIGMVCTDSRESKKTQHKGKAQKRKGQRQRGGSQRFLLCFQCIPGKFPFGSK